MTETKTLTCCGQMFFGLARWQHIVEAHGGRRYTPQANGEMFKLTVVTERQWPGSG